MSANLPPSLTLASDLDVARLDHHLRKVLNGIRGEMSITPTTGGQSNPTYFLRYGEKRFVLRKRPSGPVPASAHAIDREYRVLQALQDSDVPVPIPLHYEADASLIGTPFYVMTCVEGPTYADAALPHLMPLERAGVYRSMAETMAKLHSLDWQAAGLADYGRPGNYFERQYSRWSRYWREEAHRANPCLDTLTDWLGQHLPNSDTSALCHGDLKLNNFIFTPGKSSVAAIIDWELSTIGHPLADVAFNCMVFHTAPDENGGLLGLDLAALGIPEEEQYLETYYAASGVTERLGVFHLAFALFRAAVGAESIRVRALAGGGVSANAAEFGSRMGGAFARRAVDLIERA